ncbi:MAG TPA: thioredoxin family protein [Flavobacteriales bacterium]|jgi:hypothetical protein|nr:thioredoxin family protein [Flavobacteriales bacterium]HAW20033.1 thioredoxin family protein [Flavobacteriales bacterium]
MIDYRGIWEKGLSYNGYIELVDKKIEEGTSTSETDDASLLEYSILNAHRMNRITKGMSKKDSRVLSGKSKMRYALVITEGWCGDAAQIVPVVDAVLHQNSVEPKVVLRDKNEALMDAHLTNGARAIPVVIFLNDSFEVIAQWGPRPAEAQQIVVDWKNIPEGERPPKSEMSKQIQLWYAKDKQQAIILELESLLLG